MTGGFERTLQGGALGEALGAADAAAIVEWDRELDEWLNLVRPRVYRRSDASAQPIGDSTVVPLVLDDVDYARGDLWVASTTLVTIPRTGVWRIVGFVAWEADGTGDRVLELVDGAGAYLTLDVRPAAALITTQHVIYEGRFVVGSQVGLRCFQTSGGTLDTAGDGRPSSLAVSWVGPDPSA